MTRKSVSESRVCGNGDDEIVPAEELSTRETLNKRPLWLKKACERVPGIGIQHCDFGSVADIGDCQVECDAIGVAVVRGANKENGRAGADAAIEKTRDALRPKNRQIIGRNSVPGTKQILARFHGVPAHRIRRVAGTYLK